MEANNILAHYLYVIQLDVSGLTITEAFGCSVKVFWFFLFIFAAYESHFKKLLQSLLLVVKLPLLIVWHQTAGCTGELANDAQTWESLLPFSVLPPSSFAPRVYWLQFVALYSLAGEHLEKDSIPHFCCPWGVSTVLAVSRLSLGFRLILYFTYILISAGREIIL